MAIFGVLFQRGTPNQAGAFRVLFGQIHIWLRHRAAYWSLPFWSCQALWNLLLLFHLPNLPLCFLFFLGVVKPIVLWMVAKSCITKWMVETVETCCNPNKIMGCLPPINLWKITIFNGKIHYKWQFSIAMLVYQRVSTGAWFRWPIHSIPQPRPGDDRRGPFSRTIGTSSATWTACGPVWRLWDPSGLAQSGSWV